LIKAKGNIIETLRTPNVVYKWLKEREKYDYSDAYSMGWERGGRDRFMDRLKGK
jgi:hypothetical protein